MTKQSQKTVKKRAASSSAPDSRTAFLPPKRQWAAILKGRAQALARSAEQNIETEYLEVATFLLAYETYGFETVHVREVYPLKDLTPLPCTPEFVAGIVNVRGQVMPVIDIKKLFDLPAKGLTDLNKVVIISDGNLEFGILADAILDVRNIPLSDIKPGLPTLNGVREDYLRGVTAEQLVILDAAKLLRSENIVVNEEV